MEEEVEEEVEVEEVNWLMRATFQFSTPISVASRCVSGIRRGQKGAGGRKAYRRRGTRGEPFAVIRTDTIQILDTHSCVP